MTTHPDMTMVERVSRAIYELVNGPLDDEAWTEFWEKYTNPSVRGPQYTLNIARAAIGAMREPTDKMLHAARDWSLEKNGKPVGNDQATGCFQSMIDAALKEE